MQSQSAHGPPVSAQQVEPLLARIRALRVIRTIDGELAANERAFLNLMHRRCRARGAELELIEQRLEANNQHCLELLACRRQLVRRVGLDAIGPRVLS